VVNLHKRANRRPDQFLSVLIALDPNWTALLVDDVVADFHSVAFRRCFSDARMRVREGLHVGGRFGDG